MTVTRDFNLGTVVTVCIFLLLQTGAAIWWASQTTAHLTMLTTVSATIRADTNQRTAYVDAEQLRQWSRITSAEQTLSRVDTLNEVVQDQLQVLRAEVQTNNELLRELLSEVGALSRGN